MTAKSIAPLLAAALLVLGLSACAGKPLSHLRPEDMLSTASPSPSARTYIVICDLTSASSDGPRASAFKVVVEAAFAEKARVILVTAGATPASVHIALDVLATGDGPNATLREGQALAAREAMVSLFAREAKASEPGRLDLLGTLGALRGAFPSAGSGRVEVLVMGSGELPAADTDVEVPDLHGWRIYYLASSPQSFAREKAQAARWHEILTAAGAEDLGLSAQAPQAWPLAAAAAPSMTRLLAVRRPGGEVSVELPGEILFAFDRAALRPDAAPIVGQLAELLLSRFPKATATVSGFADAVGPEQYNEALSRRRAEAVVRALIRAGVLAKRLTAAGEGETTSSHSKAQDRRVVVTIEPAPAGR